MNIDKFWAVIDDARNEAENWEDMYDPLVDILSRLEMADLMRWKQIFDEYQHLSYKNKLWAAAYVINGGCSDDGFDYFRAWLTAQGREVFLNALNDPNSLADTDGCEGDVEFEEMLGVAAAAYFNKTNTQDYEQFYDELENGPLPEELAAAMRSEINYAPDIDVEWDDDDEESLSGLLPKLCAAFDW